MRAHLKYATRPALAEPVLRSSAALVLDTTHSSVLYSRRASDGSGGKQQTDKSRQPETTTLIHRTCAFLVSEPHLSLSEHVICQACVTDSWIFVHFATARFTYAA